jgi:hypothetical protein
MALDISTDSQFVKSINIELSLSKYEDNNNLKNVILSSLLFSKEKNFGTTIVLFIY